MNGVPVEPPFGASLRSQHSPWQGVKGKLRLRGNRSKTSEPDGMAAKLPPRLEAVAIANENVKATEDDLRRARAQLRQAMRRAYPEHSYTAIAEVLEISRQRVKQILEQE